MKKVIISIFAFCIVSICLAQNAKPFDTTVGEFFANPLGYSLDDLSFSWKLPILKDENGAERKNIKQSAYQIVVAKTPEDFEKSPVWDTGKVLSDKSVQVAYQGEPLVSRDKLYWKVRYWDENGVVSNWSDVNFFEAGLLQNSDWQGKWISATEPRTKLMRKINRPAWKSEYFSDYVSPAYFRKQVNLNKAIKSARLYVASKGIFEFYINGKKVGNEFWGTGWTDYNKRIQTNTYDITKMFESGDNTIGAIIADGWYSGRIAWKMDERGFYGERPELLAQVEITYKDGSKDVIATDQSWKYSFGGIITSDIYDGETFDARKEPNGWNENDFDDSQWKTPNAKNVEKLPLLEPRRNQPIVVKDVLSPISITKIGEGKFVFDMGQNMVGWAKIKVPADNGRTYKIAFSEMLNKDGTLYTCAYRSCQSEDFYTSAGGRLYDTWSPKFTYHGFRYVEVSGFDKNVNPKPDWVEGIVLYNDMQMTGSFFCNKPLVNKLQSCIQWGQRGNFFSTPTDCPQRNERLGWTGDAQIFCPTASFNMNVLGFFTKWTLDLADTATEDGKIAHVAPNCLGEKNGGSPAWSDAIVICPWEIYMAYGDEKILRNNYQAMKNWVAYMKNESKNFIRANCGYGDWLQPSITQLDKKTVKEKYNIPDNRHGGTPRQLIGTAYFIRCADLMAKIANILGNNDDEKYYLNLAKDVRASFTNNFVKLDGTVKGDTQTAYLLTLAFDCAPESLRKKIFENFIKTLEKTNYHLDTGFVGTPLLNPVLTRFGRNDLAYKLINNTTYPSWLYPITQGATTMWERWNSYSHKDGFGDVGMNSFNHYSYGAIGQWLYRSVAGIWYDENQAGYKNILFEPKPYGDFNFAGATHETPYGTATSSWKISDGVMEWTVIIPPNSTGTLTFPTDKPKTIRVNGMSVPPNIFKTSSTGLPQLNLGSGTYQILLRPIGFL